MTDEEQAKHKVSQLLVFWVFIDPIYAQYVSYETVLRGIKNGNKYSRELSMVVEHLCR